jgi:hypothetical protein
MIASPLEESGYRIIYIAKRGIDSYRVLLFILLLSLCFLTGCSEYTLRVGFGSYVWLAYTKLTGHAVAWWIRHCATNRKIADSIPDEVNF